MLRERYGETINGMSLLLARRLVEAGVPFITVFWKENQAIAEQVQERRRLGHPRQQLPVPRREPSARVRPRLLRPASKTWPIAACSNQTLLLVTSEMGRTPRIGDPRSGGTSGAGRDHWTHCMSVLLAGGGIQGGQVFGSSDRRGEYPAHRPVTPAHIAHTVYHAMGVDDLQATDRDGRVFNLLDEGEPLLDLF